MGRFKAIAKDVGVNSFIILLITIFSLSLWALFHAQFIVKNNSYKNINKIFDWKGEYEHYKHINSPYKDFGNDSFGDNTPSLEYKKYVMSYFNNRVVFWSSFAIISVISLLIIFIKKIIKMKGLLSLKIKHILMIPCLTLFITSFWKVRDIINSKRYERDQNDYRNPTAYHFLEKLKENNDGKSDIINLLNTRLYFWSFVLTITLICLLVYLIYKIKQTKNIGTYIVKIIVSFILNALWITPFIGAVVDGVFIDIGIRKFPY